MRYAYEPREHQNARFRHFFDQNALTLWMLGIGVLTIVLTLPAFV